MIDKSILDTGAAIDGLQFQAIQALAGAKFADSRQELSPAYLTVHESQRGNNSMVGYELRNSHLNARTKNFYDLVPFSALTIYHLLCLSEFQAPALTLCILVGE
jgi:hypothetical protein